MTGREEFERALVEEGTCPRCLGELYEGWECNGCGFNTLPLVFPEEDS